jgi:hypothetical protein
MAYAEQQTTRPSCIARFVIHHLLGQVLAFSQETAYGTTMCTLAKSFRSFCEGFDSTTIQCLCQEPESAGGVLDVCWWVKTIPWPPAPSPCQVTLAPHT